jgi:hypothetical protein
MSEEYIETVDAPDEQLSAFWPVFILAFGLFFWSGFQAYSTFRQCSNFNSQLENAGPTVKAAQDAQGKLYALAQDLLQTSAKDPYAAQIVKEANIQVRAPANNSQLDAGSAAPSSGASTNAP